MPYITRSETFRVELSAFHSTGIRGVAFVVDNHTHWVSEKTHNGNGYSEYSVEIDPQQFPAGRVEVIAMVYPMEGAARILRGDSTIYADVKNGANAFYFNVGNDLRVNVGPGRDYETVGAAVQAYGSALTKGGTIVLDPGDHLLDMPYLNNEGYALTIDGRNKANISNPQSRYRGTRNSSFHYTNCTFELDGLSGRFFRGGRDSRLMLSRCLAVCTDPEGYRKQVQTLGKAYVGDWNHGLWLEDVDIRNCWKGMNGVTTAKRVTFDRTTGDNFGGSPGAVISCTVRNNIKDETYHTQHCDIFQFSDGEVTENRIVADLLAPACQSQIGHLSKPATMKDIAFVDWVIDARTAERIPNVNMDPEIDNLLIHSAWLYGGSFNWTSEYTNVSIRDTVDAKQTRKVYPFDSYQDIQIRFTNKMGSDWGDRCVLGAIDIDEEDLTWTPRPTS